jgi:hypothetical protein
LGILNDMSCGIRIYVVIGLLLLQIIQITIYIFKMGVKAVKYEISEGNLPHTWLFPMLQVKSEFYTSATIVVSIGCPDDGYDVDS